MASMTAGQNKSSRGADAFAPPSQVSGRWVEGEGWMFIRKLTTKGNNLLIVYLLLVVIVKCTVVSFLSSIHYVIFMLPLLKNHGVVSVASCIVYCCNSYVCTLYDSMFYTRCCIPYLLCNQTWKMFVMIVWNIWFPNTSLLYPCACYLLSPPWMPSVPFLSNLWVTGWCKRLFFYIIDSKFAEEQVQASPGQRQRNLLSWGHWWTGPG